MSERSCLYATILSPCGQTVPHPRLAKPHILVRPNLTSSFSQTSHPRPAKPHILVRPNLTSSSGQTSHPRPAKPHILVQPNRTSSFSQTAHPRSAKPHILVQPNLTSSVGQTCTTTPDILVRPNCTPSSSGQTSHPCSSKLYHIIVAKLHHTLLLMHSVQGGCCQELGCPCIPPLCPFFVTPPANTSDAFCNIMLLMHSAQGGCCQELGCPCILPFFFLAPSQNK